MTALHLICGSTGAGKTTYAARLAERTSALHLSIDDWMVNLFSPYMPQAPNFTWITERVARCESQIMTTACQLGRIGVHSVLDLSLLRAEQRQNIAACAALAGLAVQLHFIDVDGAERWRRIAVRNAQKGETFRLTVTRAMFDFIETIWQPPSPHEMSHYNGVRIAA